MESFSRFSMGFEDDDDDEEEFGKREGSSQKELTVKVDGKSIEQKSNTPRSKHSATEQRRRSKINDRFQMLIGLLPNSDQKRDKASFLLEVIEYIQFLQKKVHKYESISLGWSDECSRLMLLNNRHGSSIPMDDPQVFRSGASSGLLAPDTSIPGAPSVLSSRYPAESDLFTGFPYKAMENTAAFVNKVAPAASLQPNLHPSVGRQIFLGQPQQRFHPEADNIPSQSEWLRSSLPVDCTVSNYAFNEQEELTIDEGTISASNAYSQGLFNSLSQSLQNSGIDLSQASISVHINLGRRTGSRHDTSTSIATQKDQDEPSSCNPVMAQAMVGNRSDESEAAAKRHKLDHIVAHSQAI